MDSEGDMPSTASVASQGTDALVHLHANPLHPSVHPIGHASDENASAVAALSSSVSTGHDPPLHMSLSSWGTSTCSAQSHLVGHLHFSLSTHCHADECAPPASSEPHDAAPHVKPTRGTAHPTTNTERCVGSGHSTIT